MPGASRPSNARLLVTGGAAPEVLPHLRSTVEHVPDLVLRGLAVLARLPAEPLRPMRTQRR